MSQAAFGTPACRVAMMRVTRAGWRYAQAASISARRASLRDHRIVAPARRGMSAGETTMQACPSAVSSR